MTENSYKLFFKAFSNNTRFEIIKLLRKKSMGVSEMIAKTGFEQSRISHNLKCLETCGFVNSNVKGNQRIYEIDRKHIMPILKEIDKHLKSYGKRLVNCGIMKKSNKRGCC